MNAIASKDLQYERYLKIFSKLHEPLGKCNLKEFSNITSSVNPWIASSAKSQINSNQNFR